MAAIWRRRCRAGFSPRCTTASRRRRELRAGDAAHGSTVRGGRASARHPTWVHTTRGTAGKGTAAARGADTASEDGCRSALPAGTAAHAARLFGGRGRGGWPRFGGGAAGLGTARGVLLHPGGGVSCARGTRHTAAPLGAGGRQPASPCGCARREGQRTRVGQRAKGTGGQRVREGWRARGADTAREDGFCLALLWRGDGRRS